MQNQPIDQFQPFFNNRLQDYRYSEVCSTYGGVNQRWIMVSSQPRREADLKKLAPKLQQDKKKQQKALDPLAAQEFATVCGCSQGGKSF